MSKKYQHLAAQMYQVVGAMTPSCDPIDVFDWQEYERIMNYLSALVHGECDITEDALPFNPWQPKKVT